ncbi:MAG: SH3 domain-containing protein, partial [Blautia sp.]|nr:SH3 domain-containing protein [Blautia sp.]
MKKAGVLLCAVGLSALLLSGCGFEEGAGATVTIVHETPTPIPTPTPEPTPTPVPTPTPSIATETTASGVVVSKIPGTYVTTTDVNLRDDASADANLIGGVMGGTELTGTGVCENGWIQ